VTIIDFTLIGVAAMAAGIVNALAGGGTLITFPMLVAVGVPNIIANITNTVALCPGYLSATFAQANDLKDQTHRLWLVIPTGVVGGIIGGILLLNTGERLFSQLVPYLILLASGLLAVQTPLRNWLTQFTKRRRSNARFEFFLVLPILVAAIYGGYFGAGVSVIVLAVLGLILSDSLTKLNALKQSISFSCNISAAIYFAFSGNVLWPAAAVMAGGALLGGALGGRLASRIAPATLRWTVVTIGVVVAVIYLLR
jgi:uncharacterized membrane protein YfcA